MKYGSIFTRKVLFAHFRKQGWKILDKIFQLKLTKIFINTANNVTDNKIIDILTVLQSVDVVSALSSNTFHFFIDITRQDWFNQLLETLWWLGLSIFVECGLTILSTPAFSIELQSKYFPAFSKSGICTAAGKTDGNELWKGDENVWKLCKMPGTFSGLKYSQITPPTPQLFLENQRFQILVRSE